MKPQRLFTVVMVISATCLNGCAASGEQDLLREIEVAVTKARAVDARNTTAASVAYQDAIDAMTRYLEQYPDSNQASEIRDRRERFYSELRSLRESNSAYEALLKQEPDESQPQLPSDCQRVAQRWADFLGRYPNSDHAAAARQKRARWEAKAQEEIQRGFQVVFLEAEIARVKGAAHGMMAGHPWDSEFFGAGMLPDPYVVLLVNGQPAGSTLPARDTLHPVWLKESSVVHISDDQQVSLTVRDRDLINDDDICHWTGALHELIENRGNLANIGDCVRLRVRVIRPK
jgi:C2 domain